MNNEKDFSNAVVAAFKKHNCLPQTIETYTGPGVPDLSVSCFGNNIWIELKVLNSSVEDGKWKIPWRRFQQAWMLQRYRLTKKPCFTIVALNDGFLVAPMVKHFAKNIVSIKEVFLLKRLDSVVSIINNLIK